MIENTENLYQQVSSLIDLARRTVVRNTDRTMVTTYFLIGKYIIDEEQVGQDRASYAKKVIENLSQKLKIKYGKGFSVRNLELMRRFYVAYRPSIPQNSSAELVSHKNIPELFSNTQQTLDFKLGWSQYVLLSRIKNLAEREFYEVEAVKNEWGIEELKRQFDSSLFERLVLSTDKEKVLVLSKKGQIIQQPQDLIKEPLILEFLGLEEKSIYSENELETAIINQIETFMLELGRGFFYGGRQVRFTFDEQHFFVDLVFYNRILKCFVLIDLKIGRLKHQDIGQMQMYVNYYDRFVKDETETPTIGIIVCKDKSDAIVEITLPKDNSQIFASQYQLCLPSKEELKALIMNNL